MSKLVPKLVPFKAGQTWSHEWHYDWASFGELPPQYDKIYIVKRTAKMRNLFQPLRLRLLQFCFVIG